MNPEFRKGLLAGVLLAVSLLSVNYFLYVKKITTENASLKSQLSKLEGERRKLLKLIKDMKKLKARRDLLLKEIKSLKQLLPKTEDIPGLIRSIAHLARISGVDLNRVEMGREVVYPEKHYAAVDIKVSFSSTYAQLVSFLEKVDNLKRLVRPYKLSITSKGISKDPKLSVGGLLQTYRYVEAKKAKKKGKRKRRKK